MKRILKYTLIGIASGCTVFVILGMIFASIWGDEALLTGNRFICYALASMVVGIGFSVPAIVYDNENLAMLFKVLIHMGTGFAIYFFIGLPLGWIPLEYGVGAAVLTVACALGTSVLIWLGFYLYRCHEAQQINRHLTDR